MAAPSLNSLIGKVLWVRLFRQPSNSACFRRILALGSWFFQPLASRFAIWRINIPLMALK